MGFVFVFEHSGECMAFGFTSPECDSAPSLEFCRRGSPPEVARDFAWWASSGWPLRLRVRDSIPAAERLDLAEFCARLLAAHYAGSGDFALTASLVAGDETAPAVQLLARAASFQAFAAALDSCAVPFDTL
jgi:hypothetical protein